MQLSAAGARAREILKRYFGIPKDTSTVLMKLEENKVSYTLEDRAIINYSE